VPGGDHRAQHLIPAALGPFQIGDGGEAAGRPGDAGDGRHLAQIEVRDRLVEVAPGGGGHPVGSLAEEDLVQVKREDLVLRVAGLQPAGEDRLGDLAQEAAREEQLGVEERSGHLLGDCGAALRDLAGAHVGQHRPHDAPVIEAPVLVEAAILDADERLDEQRRDLLGGDHLPALGGPVGQDGPIPGAQLRRLGRLVLVARDVRQPGQPRREIGVRGKASQEHRPHQAQGPEGVELDQPMEEAAVRLIDDFDSLKRRLGLRAAPPHARHFTSLVGDSHRRGGRRR
jgi:hypothetical protein